MSLALTGVALVLASNIILGIVLVLGVFSLMGRNVALGAVGGLIVGAAAIYAELQIGEIVFDQTFSEIRLMIIVAALGAVSGVVGSALTVKPEL